MTSFVGGCSCGSIRFSFNEEPINAVFCYCTSCQIHTGSDKWFGLWVSTKNFIFTKGTPSTFTRLGDSGKEMHHRFCASCGTTVCVEVTVAGFYSVATTALDSGHNFLPKMAIYTSSAPAWAVFPADVPAYEKLPPRSGH